MARTLKQIQRELDKTGGYAADRKLLNSQLNSLPGQYQAQAAGLDAKLGQANDNILQSARGRGLGFSGIPIQEQAQYAATEYAPALANLKTQSESNRMGILQSLNSLSRDQRSQAQSIYDNNRNFREQQRQFNQQQKLAREQMAASQRAASSASAGDYLGALLGGGGGGGGSKVKGPQAKMAQRKDSGFNFSIDGKPVSAAVYAKATGTEFRKLLSTMAKKGDGGAKLALKYYGNDYGYDAGKLYDTYRTNPVGLKQAQAVVNAMRWGL